MLELRSGLIDLEALIIYDIDFPEEDDGPIPRERVGHCRKRNCESLEALLATAPAGELIREGAIVVIAGPPNAGQVLTFQCPSRKIQGDRDRNSRTTRDALEAVIDSGEWPLRLVDTAGLRRYRGSIERIGIEVSERYLGDAACGSRLSRKCRRVSNETVRADCQEFECAHSARSHQS